MMYDGSLANSSNTCKDMDQAVHIRTTWRLGVCSRLWILGSRLARLKCTANAGQTCTSATE